MSRELQLPPGHPYYEWAHRPKPLRVPRPRPLYNQGLLDQLRANPGCWYAWPSPVAYPHDLASKINRGRRRGWAPTEVEARVVEGRVYVRAKPR